MPSFDYLGSYAYHLVLLTQDRSPHFKNASLARRCATHLRSVDSAASFRLLAYCFMPDHLHVLVLGEEDASNVVRFVQRFKQQTGYHFKRSTGRRLWQQSFYDRALRVEEDLAQVADYIFGNPVTVGLVDDACDYPLSGGEYFDADEAEASSLRPATVAKRREQADG